MSTLDEREQLIQQRQAEKYVNVIRMTILGVLTVALAVQGGEPWILLSPGSTPWRFSGRSHGGSSLATSPG